MTIAVRHISADGYTTISSKTWGSINAGTSTTAEKYFVWNVGERALTGLTFNILQVASGDGYTFMKWAADTSGTLSCPYSVSATVSTAGGSIASGVTYYYKITGTNATGETTGSLEVSATTTTGSSNSVSLAWVQLSGATGYKVYRSTTSGSYGASSLLTTIGSGSTIVYVDTGTATTSGTVPTANTTGGAAPTYGTAPTLGTSSINIGTLAIGQQWVYWVGVTVGAATTETGNTRYAERTFAEA